MNTAILKSSPRVTLAFSLAGIAIVLRMASDWLFPTGGPLPYQLAQATCLTLALVALWPNLSIVFLQGGDTRSAIQQGLLAIPLGLSVGLGWAWLRFGGPQWPTFDQLTGPIASNVFFTAVEELEFRGFLLAWLLRRGLSPTAALWLQAIIHTLAHIHRLWQGDFLSLAMTLLVTAWFGWLTYRTRSVWGAWVAHLSWNLGILLPELGTGLNIR